MYLSCLAHPTAHKTAYGITLKTMEHSELNCL